jgi:hypothetical protein
VKVTSRGRKLFIVLYWVAGAGTRVRKYTIGPYGRVTASGAACRSTRVHGHAWRDVIRPPEKLNIRRRHVVDRIADLVETYVADRVSKTRGANLSQKTESDGRSCCIAVR